MKPKSFLISFLFLFIQLFYFFSGSAQNWQIIKPTNHGVPGPLVRLAKFDPQGNLWVAARWPFWREGGISKFDGIKWKAYSNVDSWMPTDIVNDVAFEPNGTAWIGTDSGLIRFDGNNAQRFTMTTSPFPSNNIRTVRIDGLGNVWFISKEPSTTAHALIKYDGTNWTIFNSSNSGIPYFDITTFEIDPANRIWLGTWALGIAVYDGVQWTNYNSSNSNFNGGEISGFEFMQNGDVLVTASGSGIYKFSNNTWQQLPGLAGNHSYSTVARHPDGSLWFGTYGGLLIKYDGTSFFPYSYGNHLYTIDFDAQGNVWAGGLAEVKKYVNGVNTLSYSVYNTSLTSYFVENMDFFPNGTGWFATSMGGVCSYNGTVWRGFNPNNYGFEPWTFQHNSANDLYIDKQTGNVWVASNGVGYWNGSSWTIFTLSNSNIPDNGVDKITKDGQGRIWIGTSGYGAAYFNGSLWSRLNFGNFASNTINDIQASPDGSVWFATDLGLHKTTDGNSFVSFYQANSGLPSDFITSVCFESNGTMWVGTSNGLVKYTNNTWTLFNETNSGLPANKISDIEAGTPGTIWVSAYNTLLWPYYGGFARFDGTNWTKYTPQNSPLTHYQVEKLKIDPFGYLWISTYSEGMMKFQIPGAGTLPVSLLSFTAQKVGTAVKLNWSTITEENSKQFIIERAKGLVFEPIGSISSTGFSQSVKSYTFNDENPFPGNNYYRLKMTDKDDKFSYSQIVKINFNLANEFLVRTNPVNSSLHLTYKSLNVNVNINIYDASGRRVISKSIYNESTISIGVEKLNPGIYIVELIDGRKSYREKFVKTD